MTTDLKGRVAVVTGSASGIGRGAALRLAAEGAKLVCLDAQREPRSAEIDGDVGTDALIVARGGEAIHIAVDVSDAAAMERAMSACGETFGRLDMLVNCAGININGRITELKPEEFDKVISVNLRGVWLACKFAVEQMMSRDAGSAGLRGSIVNVASATALMGIPNSSAYTASKSAILGLTRQLAVELAPQQITANCVAPGPVTTALMLESFTDVRMAHDMDWASNIPLGRPGQVDDVAEAIVYLTKAKWTTGMTLTVDGGQSAA